VEKHTLFSKEHSIW